MNEYERYEEIQRLSKEYEPKELERMFKHSLGNDRSMERSMIFAFAMMFNYIEQIEEIKQCLNEKQDKFKIEKPPTPYFAPIEFLSKEEKKDE